MASRISCLAFPIEWLTKLVLRASKAGFNTGVDAGQIPAAIAFVLALSCFAFYQLAVSVLSIYPFMGGGFTVLLLFSLPFLLYSANKQKGHFRLLSNGDFWAAVLFIFLVLVHIGVGVAYDKNQTILETHYAFIVKFFVLFLLGLVVNIGHKRVVFISVASMIFCLLVLVAVPYELSTTYVEIDGLDDLVQLNYQAVAGVVLIFFLSGSSIYRSHLRSAVYLCGLVVLYKLGARFELVCALIIAIVVESFRLSTYVKFIVFMFFLFLLLLLLPMHFLGWGDFEVGQNRVFGLFNLSDDPSALKRIDLTSDAISSILSSPFLGDYASYEPGMFSHNILSAWVDFGFLGFLLLSYLIINPFRRMIVWRRLRQTDPAYVIVFSLSLILVISVLVAKDYTYFMIPLFMGVYFRYSAIWHKNFIGYGLEDGQFYK